MISEIKFSTNYSSFWREIIPLADNYLRKENLRLERHTIEVRNLTRPALRGFTNELAFFAFAKIRKSKIKNYNKKELLISNWKATAVYINRIPNAEKIDENNVSSEIVNESLEILGNLLSYFTSARNYEVKPKFAGCGLLDACEGDYIDSSCLYEIKAGDRNFRITDIRQLLIYSALDYSANRNRFEKIGLFNPRTGLFWVRNLNDVLLEVSGQSASEVLPKICAMLENLDVTK